MVEMVVVDISRKGVTGDATETHIAVRLSDYQMDRKQLLSDYHHLF